MVNGKLWIAIGGASGFLSVAAGAFGAHGLKDKLSAEMLAIFETAARYQMYHAFAMILIGIIAGGSAMKSAHVAGWAFLAGTILFSGSLYALALTGVRSLGAITPFGGVAFLIGWAAICVYGLSR